MHANVQQFLIMLKNNLAWANHIFFKTCDPFEHFFFCACLHVFAPVSHFFAPVSHWPCGAKISPQLNNCHICSLASCDAIVKFQQIPITRCFLQELFSEGLHCLKPTIWNHCLWVIHHVTENCHHVSIQPGIFQRQNFKQFLVWHLNIGIVLGPYKTQNHSMQQHKFMLIAQQCFSSTGRWVNLQSSKGPIVVFQTQADRSLAHMKKSIVLKSLLSECMHNYVNIPGSQRLSNSCSHTICHLSDLISMHAIFNIY